MEAETPDIQAIVSRSPWFSELSGEGMQQLVDASQIRVYEKNAYLYRTGDVSGDVYCVLSGRIRLFLTSTLGQEYAINDIEAEFWLGEQFLVGDRPAVLDAQVAETATVLVIPRAIVLQVADADNSVYKMLFEHTMQRSRGIFMLLQGMAFYPLRSRLAGWILSLIEEHGEQSADGIYLDINLSQSDLAQLSLGSRQRINKILSEWRDQGIIDNRASRYLIRDVEALTRETELKDGDG